MLSIGIDQSLSNTAIVVLPHFLEVQNVYNYKTSNYFVKGKGVQFEAKRLNMIRRFIVEHCPGAYPTAIEGYSLQSTHRGYALGEVAGVIKEAVVSNCGTLYIIPPTSVKLFAVGHGFAPKEDMIKAAQKESPYIARLPKKELTDDVCDAFFLAKMVSYINYPESAVKYEINKDLLRHRLDYVDGVTYHE